MITNHVVTKERKFMPHLMLLEAARRSLDAADIRKKDQWWHCLSAMVHAALAFEAIGNVFGEHLIPRWDDYQSASPVAKLRLVAAHLGLTPDFDIFPWCVLPKIVKFRNAIAHGKPQKISTKEVHSPSAIDMEIMAKPLSKLEKQVSRGSAAEALLAAESIIREFLSRLDEEQSESIRSDFYSGSVEPE